MLPPLPPAPRDEVSTGLFNEFVAQDAASPFIRGRSYESIWPEGWTTHTTTLIGIRAEQANDDQTVTKMLARFPHLWVVDVTGAWEDGKYYIYAYMDQAFRHDYVEAERRNSMLLE